MSNGCNSCNDVQIRHEHVCLFRKVREFYLVSIINSAPRKLISSALVIYLNLIELTDLTDL